MDKHNFYAVILAGGGGTRLWPRSRKKSPKHLLKLIGEETLLKMTYNRIAGVIPDDQIYVVTLKDHASEVMEQLPQVPKANFIIEPIQRNTAWAMGAAAAIIHKKNPDAAIVNLAADHIYKDVKKFQNTILDALDVTANTEYIVAIGIRPTFAHTGLGYIRVGEPIEGASKLQNFVFKSRGFKEKPNLTTAQAFLATGQYLWNANLYCWSTKTVLNTYNELAPDIYKGLERIVEAADTGGFENTLADVYDKAENIQIDYAISEKAKNLVVVPGEFGWSDIGDWKVVYDSLDKDLEGNVILDETKNSYIGIDTKKSLIEVNGRMIVAIGLENVVIIDTEDAILICNKDRTQDVKKAVEKLKENKQDNFL